MLILRLNGIGESASAFIAALNERVFVQCRRQEFLRA